MVKCPYCGAEFEAPPDVSTVTCPYCGTIFNVATMESVKEHFFYPVVYDSTSAFKRLMAFVSRQYGAPSDIGSSGMASRMLHYIPIYVYKLTGIAVCGTKKVYEDEEYVSVVGLTRLPIPVPYDYRFPVRGKRYFEAKVYEYGRYYNPDIDPKTYEKTLRQGIASRAYREGRLTCGNPLIEAVAEYEGVVHYPFWEFSYSYRGSTYRGIVDAVDGLVVWAQHPQNPKHMNILKTVGVAVILGGLIIGAGLGAAIAKLTGLLLGSVGGLIAGIAGGVSPLSRGFKKVVVATQIRTGKKRKEGFLKGFKALRGLGITWLEI